MGRPLIPALALVALAGCSAETYTGEEAPQLFSSTSMVCLDEDGDGYGINCVLGADCYDYDPDLNVVCPTAFNPGVGQPCAKSADCAPGFACSQGTCVVGAGLACASDGDCAEGAICEHGRCASAVGHPCASDGDCGGGGYARCVGKVCTPASGAGQAGGSSPSVCVAGAVQPCTTSCGSTSTQTCDGAGRWGACSPMPRENSCDDQQDNDCDGLVDRQDAADCGPTACVAGATKDCTTACGSVGRSTCEGAGAWSACKPPASEGVCNDGVDNDCDGLVDWNDTADCVPRDHYCTDAGYTSCSNDTGVGDRCDPKYNTGGCSKEQFYAWCNRRNPQTPNAWFDFLRGWVAEHCPGGEVKYVDPNGNGKGDYFVCTTSSGDRYICKTPLVVAFDADSPVEFASVAHSFLLDASMPDARVDWPTAATPWLALDRNGNGRIDDGGELFGSATRLATGALATHGFEALGALDDNHDGRIDSADAVWAELVLWRDHDRDGRSSQGELSSVERAGLLSIELAFSALPRCDARGNCERERARMTWRDAAGRLRTGAVIDVYLSLHVR